MRFPKTFALCLHPGDKHPTYNGGIRDQAHIFRAPRDETLDPFRGHHFHLECLRVLRRKALFALQTTIGLGDERSGNSSPLRLSHP